MRSLLLMIQFMTRYPVPIPIEFTAERFVQGIVWMPLVGLLVGIPAALLYSLLGPPLGEELAACFAVIYLITVTGGLHLDGIGDTSDGLFCYKPRERVLEIMRESTLGTNAVIAIVLVILLKFLLIKNIGVPGGIALCCAPVLGRLGSSWHAASSCYARQGSGMGAFVDQVGMTQAVYATIISVILVGAILLLSSLSPGNILIFTLVLHIPVIVVAVLFARYLKARIGGITGDTIGATIELTEIVAFLFFFLLWNRLL